MSFPIIEYNRLYSIVRTWSSFPADEGQKLHIWLLSCPVFSHARLHSTIWVIFHNMNWSPRIKSHVTWGAYAFKVHVCTHVSYRYLHKKLDELLSVTIGCTQILFRIQIQSLAIFMSKQIIWLLRMTSGYMMHNDNQKSRNANLGALHWI